MTFSPLFGFHFFLAAAVAWVMRGNIIAALLSTFVGNPLTFVPIAATSLQTGYFLLGREGGDNEEVHRSLGGKFVDAWDDLKNNMMAFFTDRETDWHNLNIFYDEVFLPYLVGGLVPGVIAGVIGYYLSLPVIQAYQNRRKGRLKAKLLALKEKKAAKADAKAKRD